MLAISAFQDAAGNLKPKEFHSLLPHEIARTNRGERSSLRNKQKLALPLKSFLEAALRADGSEWMTNDGGQQG